MLFWLPDRVPHLKGPSQKGESVGKPFTRDLREFGTIVTLINLPEHVNLGFARFRKMILSKMVLDFLGSFRIIWCIRNQNSGFWGSLTFPPVPNIINVIRLLIFLEVNIENACFPKILIFLQSIWPFPKLDFYGKNALAAPTICYAILSHSPNRA